MVRKANLRGYKREGKRFIPPMKQLPLLREQSYVNDMLPELIWVGLLHDRGGYRFGADALEAIIEVTNTWPKQDKIVNYATQSAFASLQPDQQHSVHAALARGGYLEDIQSALAPLTLLYDDFSLSFLGLPTTVVSRELLNQQMTDSVRNHLNKYETPGILLHGSMLLTRLFARTITFSSTIDIPDFNAVIDQPNSTEANRAAAFMRANALAEFGMLGISTQWATHFWNRSAHISPCKLPAYANEW
jgi:hypothetical protein